MSVRDPWEDVTAGQFVRAIGGGIIGMSLVGAAVIAGLYFYEAEVLGAMRWIGLPVVDSIDWF